MGMNDTTGLPGPNQGTIHIMSHELDEACPAPAAEPQKEEPLEGWRAYERAQFRYAEERYQQSHRGDFDRNRAQRRHPRPDRPRNKLRREQSTTCSGRT